MKCAAIALILASTLAACAAVSDASHITPEQAVLQAAAAAPRYVAGVFEMEVKTTGTQNGVVYLNSEADYRDQRNLTIAISPQAVSRFSASGIDPLQAFTGKRVLVKGAASRVTIFMFMDNKKSDKYYYQTHVAVLDPQQITLAN